MVSQYFYLIFVHLLLTNWKIINLTFFGLLNKSEIYTFISFLKAKVITFFGLYIFALIHLYFYI